MKEKLKGEKESKDSKMLTRNGRERSEGDEDKTLVKDIIRDTLLGHEYARFLALFPLTARVSTQEESTLDLLRRCGGLDGFVNSVKKLQRRAISSKRLKEECDTHDLKRHCSIVFQFLMKMSRIIEIVAACNIVFVLT
ncbi:Uncharacterized protein Fot_03180 [Forsythia ovata]|uniref:Uncharacterized protein n=1 Tax=Forsythia ovata TaxID=205694 RepID=A0ABD1X9I9_9LAMI